MTSREFKGEMPPRTAIGSRFCSFIDAELTSDGGFNLRPAYGLLYVLRDGRVVVDPLSRDGSEKPAVFPGMPDGFEILGKGDEE